MQVVSRHPGRKPEGLRSLQPGLQRKEVRLMAWFPQQENQRIPCRLGCRMDFESPRAMEIHAQKSCKNRVSK